MRGHFGIFKTDSGQIGGCLSWTLEKGIYHTGDWFLFKDIKSFIADFYSIDNDEPDIVKTGNVELICSHRINLNHWSRGAITLKEQNEQ